MHSSRSVTLNALAHNAVFADVDVVDRSAAALRDRRDLDVRAVLDVKPDGNIQIRLLCESAALAGDAALDGKRHLERRSTLVQPVIDLPERHRVGNIEFAGKGCGYRVLQISSRICHNLFLLYCVLFFCFAFPVQSRRAL